VTYPGSKTRVEIIHSNKKKKWGFFPRGKAVEMSDNHPPLFIPMLKKE
jgi:hypothetical protein